MNRSIGGFILYIATALYLLVVGISGLTGKGGTLLGMTSVFSGGGLASAIAYIFALGAVVAGILLLLQLFGMQFGIIEIILIAFTVLWIIFILVVDVFHALKGNAGFWSWLGTLASHLLVLGAIASCTRALGGK
jgi:hypothetical protein